MEIINESIETIFDSKQNELLVKIVQGQIKEDDVNFNYFCILDENLNMYIDDMAYTSLWTIDTYCKSSKLKFAAPNTLYVYCSNSARPTYTTINILTGIQCGTLTRIMLQSNNEFFSEIYSCCDNLIKFLNDPSNYPSSVPILK